MGVELSVPTGISLISSPVHGEFVVCVLSHRVMGLSQVGNRPLTPTPEATNKADGLDNPTPIDLPWTLHHITGRQVAMSAGCSWSFFPAAWPPP